MEVEQKTSPRVRPTYLLPDLTNPEMRYKVFKYIYDILYDDYKLYTELLHALPSKYFDEYIEYEDNLLKKRKRPSFDLTQMEPKRPRSNSGYGRRKRSKKSKSKRSKNGKRSIKTKKSRR